MKPAANEAGAITTDAIYRATDIISNADYSEAQNYCVDGGGTLQVSRGGSRLNVIGKDLPAGNCFGVAKGNS